MPRGGLSGGAKYVGSASYFRLLRALRGLVLLVVMCAKAMCIAFIFEFIIGTGAFDFVAVIVVAEGAIGARIIGAGVLWFEARFVRYAFRIFIGEDAVLGYAMRRNDRFMADRLGVTFRYTVEMTGGSAVADRLTGVLMDPIITEGI